jgi:voltage-dependent calcium channel T type alpha-1G
MEDELDMEVELERELAAEQEELLEEEEAEAEAVLQQALDRDRQHQQVKKPLNKVLSLPANFTFSSPRASVDTQEGLSHCLKLRGIYAWSFDSSVNTGLDDWGSLFFC